MAYLPLELNEELLIKFNPDTDYLDLTQLCNLILGKNDLNFLNYDGATKIFTTIFNNTSLQAFEILIIKLLEELLTNRIPMQFYHIIKSSKQHSEYTIRKIDNITNKGNLGRVVRIGEPFTIASVTKQGKKFIPINPIYDFIGGVYVLCLFEYDEGDFGHYGTMFFNGIDTIHIFDSMMRSSNNIVEESAYKFKDLFITPLFKIPIGISYIYDLYSTDLPNIFSLEITGGSYNVVNPLITTDNIFHAFKQYILGVDNQNQFCYMWGILYIIITGINIIREKYAQPSFSFIDLHRIIIANRIIPVVAIKTFILLLLQNYKAPDPDTDYNKNIRRILVDDVFFMTNFNKFVSNGTDYSTIFQDPVHDFKSYIFWNNVHAQETESLIDICDFFRLALDDLHYQELTPMLSSNFMCNGENLEVYIHKHIEQFFISTGYDLYKDISEGEIYNKNIYNYLEALEKKYKYLTISLIRAEFKKSNKTGRNNLKTGGSNNIITSRSNKKVSSKNNKITYYKFTNKIIK